MTSDFDDYFDTQRIIDGDYRSTDDWTRKSILNTARMGWFSSDRTISGYAHEIWSVSGLKDG